jgi:hypothetical protein
MRPSKLRQAVLFRKKEPRNLALIAKLVESGGRKQASASFLKKRSKKLLSVAMYENVTISRWARAKPIGSCVRITVGVARYCDGLRRKEGSGNDALEKVFLPRFPEDPSRWPCGAGPG